LRHLRFSGGLKDDEREVKVLDRAGVRDLRCWVEGGEAVVELSLNHAAVLEAGFGRLQAGERGGLGRLSGFQPA